MRFTIMNIAAPLLLCVPQMAMAAPQTPRRVSLAIARDGLEKGVRAFVAAKLRNRPYFMGTTDKSCDSVAPAPDGFEAVTVIDCKYKEGGLDGWVRLAVPKADLIADWILKAASQCRDPKRCAAKIAEDSWGSNQYSFPIAGNIIEPASSAGGTGSASTNLIFVYGVTVARPAFLPGKTSIPIASQKACALALLATADGKSADPVPGDTGKSCTSLISAQVSRPAAVRQDIYADYGDPAKTKHQRQSEIGSSCPASARTVAWLAVSRASFRTGIATRQHPLFDAAARAIDDGQTYLGTMRCGRRAR